MKITLNKSAITLDAVPTFKTLIADWKEWIDESVIRQRINEVLDKTCTEIIKMPTLEATYNGYRPCVYANDALISFFDRNHWIISSISFTVAYDTGIADGRSACRRDFIGGDSYVQ